MSGFLRGRVEAAKQVLVEGARKAPPLIIGEPPAPAPRTLGFTGNTCFNCGGAHLIQSGHCEVCTSCGTTTGCS